MNNSVRTELELDRGRSSLDLNDGEHLGSRPGSSARPKLRAFKGRKNLQDNIVDEALASHWAPMKLEVSRIYTMAMNSLDIPITQSRKTSPYKISINVGLSEECCCSLLPAVIALFEQYNPSFAITMYANKYDLLTNSIKPVIGILDLILLPRGKGVYDSEIFWEDKLMWISQPGLNLADDRPIDLILPESWIPTRFEPMGALSRADRQFRVRFESGNHVGLQSAFRAGLGVGAGFKRIRLFEGVTEMPQSCDLPELPEVQFVMAGLQPSSCEEVRSFAAFLKAAASWSFESLTR